VVDGLAKEIGLSDRTNWSLGGHLFFPKM